MNLKTAVQTTKNTKFTKHSAIDKTLQRTRALKGLESISFCFSSCSSCSSCLIEFFRRNTRYTKTAATARGVLLGLLLGLGALALPAGADEVKVLGAHDLPIHDVARMGSGKDVARILKADPQSRDARTVAQGSQPIHLAATNPDTSALKALIAAGADPNARDNDASTPLHMAVYTQKVEHTQLLLDAGADPKAKNNLGRDVLSLARKQMANEAAGIISLWILKGCQPKKPC